MRFPDRLQATLWPCCWLVWIAAWLVPASRRREWRAAQNLKFFHWCHFLAESGQLTKQNQLLIARKTWAVFPEALWTRLDREHAQSRTRQFIGSPLTFLATLALAAILLTVGSGIIPAARSAFVSSLPHPEQLVLITLDGKGINGTFSRVRSDTLLDLAGIWRQSKLAAGLAPFSWGPATLLLQSRDLPVATARVSAGFFATVGVKAAMGRTFTSDDSQTCPGCVVLSHSLWQHEFRADPEIVGKQVVLNGSPRPVIGVLPANVRLVSPGIAVWGLIDPAVLFTNFQRRIGAIARLSGDATPARLQSSLSDLTESAGYVHPSSELQVISIAAQTRRSLWNAVWLLLLVIACALLVVLMRRASVGWVHLPEEMAERVSWLAFLAAKSALLLALAALLAWSAVHWVATGTMGSAAPLADEYAIWLFLPLAILALSWSVRDQQQRCRVCLRRLALPVEIGRSGSVLLNWAGTEMVCPDGHGVLYLPESPANSLDQDRWSRLDDSWESLFRP